MIALRRKDRSSAGQAYLRPKSARYLALLDGHERVPDDLAASYRNRLVKDDLLDETNQKCAYCESKVRHVYPGDVEHVRPKSRFPRLRLEYDNLTFSCWNCNNAKLDYYDEQQPVVDPYSDLTTEQFYAFGPLIFGSPGKDRGKVSEEVLKLNRPELVERRDARLKQIRTLVDHYAKLGPGVVKDAVKEQLREETLPTAEFSFAVRELLRCMKVDV